MRSQSINRRSPIRSRLNRPRNMFSHQLNPRVTLQVTA
jgi:hypothetical protein